MARRRVNGEGTIYRRKDGRYEGAAYFLTASGHRKRVRVYGRTRAEAHAKLTEAKAGAQRGTPVPDRTWKLGDFLDYWLDSVVRPNRRPATFAQCETIARLYLKPGLGASSLTRLSVPMVQAFVNSMIADGHSIPKVQIMRKVLSSALTCAVREELLSRNVAQLVQFPTYQPPEVQPWTADEAKQFLHVARRHSLYAAFVLLMLCGMRRGEVLGLRWGDVDLDASILHVRQQLGRAGRQLLQGPLKTKAGRRDLPLLGLAHEALTAHQVHQQVARASAGQTWHGSGDQLELVFTTSTGRPVEPRNLARTFHALCSNHQLRRIKVHDLRHTTATLLKQLGVPARDAQLILGHSRVSTTQQIYQHDDMDSRREALGRIEEMLGTQNGYAAGRSRQVCLRCRQNQPSSMNFGVTMTTVLSGAGAGTLTRGLILGKATQHSLDDRITSVRDIIHTRTRQWLLGCVAVNLAVRCESA